MQEEWRRDRKFQQRLLAALDRPKKHWFIRIVNSAAFLWLATLLLVTVGGGFLTNYQQCIRDADLLSERHARIFRALHTRQKAFATLIETSATVEDIRAGVAKLPYTYSDLRERTLFDLNREFELIHTKIDDSALPLAVKGEAVLVADWLTFSLNLYQGEIPLTLTNDGLSAFKKFSKTYFEAFNKRFVQRAFDIFQPKCTVKNTLLYALGFRGVKIVETTVSRPILNFLNLDDILKQNNILKPRL
jgi:hypothetical protein